MNEFERQAAQRIDAINKATADVLAERYGVYDTEVLTDRPDRMDLHALDQHHDPINDLSVRVVIEDGDVVSVYTLDSSPILMRSARLTQMPPTAVAVLVAHELTRDGEDVHA